MIGRGIVIQMTQALIAFMKSLRNNALQALHHIYHSNQIHYIYENFKC